MAVKSFITLAPLVGVYAIDRGLLGRQRWDCDIVPVWNWFGCHHVEKNFCNQTVSPKPVLYRPNDVISYPSTEELHAIDILLLPDATVFYVFMSQLLMSLRNKVRKKSALKTTWGQCYKHRDRTRASTLCFLFLILFSSFEHVKSLLIMGPNNTKNSSLKCDLLIINYE